jgi:hypothetical protein
LTVLGCWVGHDWIHTGVTTPIGAALLCTFTVTVTRAGLNTKTNSRGGGALGGNRNRVKTSPPTPSLTAELGASTVSVQVTTDHTAGTVQGTSRAGYIAGSVVADGAALSWYSHRILTRRRSAVHYCTVQLTIVACAKLAITRVVCPMVGDDVSVT